MEIIHLSQGPDKNLIIQVESAKEQSLLIVDENRKIGKIVNKIFIQDFKVRSSFILPSNNEEMDNEEETKLPEFEMWTKRANRQHEDLLFEI